MARLSKEEQARREGMQVALDWVEKLGLDGAKKELEYRGIHGIPIQVNKSDLNKFNETVKQNCINTMTTLCCWALHDEFGFGHERLQKFIDAANYKADSLARSFCCWEDVIEMMFDETGVHFTIPNECIEAENETTNSIGVVKK